MIKKWIALAITASLTGCGGGGGGSDDDGGGGISGGGGSSSPDEITITAVSYNECVQQIPFADADVVFHNGNGGIISSQRLGSSGTATLQWPNGAEHITIAGTSEDENGQSIARIETYTSVRGASRLPNIFFNPATPAGYECGCQTLTLDSSSIEQSYPNHSVHVNIPALRQQYRLGNGFADIRVCPDQQGQWQPVEIVLEPNGFSGEVAYYTSTIIDPTANSGFYQLPVELFDNAQQSSQVAVDVEGDNYWVRTFTNGLQGRSAPLWADQGDLINYFPQIEGRAMAVGYFSESITSLPEGDADYFSGSRSAIVNDAASINMKADMFLFSDEAARLVNNAIGNGTDDSYNFAQFSQGKELLTVTLTGSLPAPRWSVTAPLAGTMPEFDLPATYLNALAQISQPTMWIDVVGYDKTNDYQQALENIAIEGDKGDPRSAYFDNYSYETLRVTTN